MSEEFPGRFLPKGELPEPGKLGGRFASIPQTMEIIEIPADPEDPYSLPTFESRPVSPEDNIV